MTPRKRIRAQGSPNDPDVMGFVLDAPVQQGRSARFENRKDQTTSVPLSIALFGIDGVTRIEVNEATIWVRKAAGADWVLLKPAIAEAIRQVLDATEAPLGVDDREGALDDPDATLLLAVQDLLEQQVNPSVAAHGGSISAERVDGGTVFLRMSGGCQGCAASAATLRQGVERMLRAALPRIVEIVDVTDHDAGSTPFYSREDGPSPVFNRPVPSGVIDWNDGQLMVAPDYLAPRLGLTPDALRKGLRSGDVVGVTETGEGADVGKTRIILRSATRAWAAEVLPDGSAREIPPPRETGAAADRKQALTDRARAFLAGLSPEEVPITYGALARGLGLWAPGSVRRITSALEATMREDAVADRPFIAARVVSRGREGIPAPGFFELADALSRGRRNGESDAEFHARELAALDRRLTDSISPEDVATALSL